MLYGGEYGGGRGTTNWKEQERYLRWILRLNKQTLTYIVMEETKMNKLRLEAGKGALTIE